MADARPAGVILAGGRSKRMGSGPKAQSQLHDEPIIGHVIRRLLPQVDLLLLNVAPQAVGFESYGLQLVPDLLPGHRGPLTGLYSALTHLSEMGLDNGLVLCPCDAPFLPPELVATLLYGVRENSQSVSVVSYEGILQPTFSLWQNHHLPVVREAVEQGHGGLKYLLESLPHTVVEWAPAEPSPFFNVNTPDELETAARWLDHMPA
jgi:molybdopterin-guanine dinucleotide biosynthesis protein A